METQEQSSKPSVIKVDSPEAWELYMNQANAQGTPVVVHFTASWCIPSLAMNPFFEEMASAYPDASFFTVDVDDVKEVASKLDVTAMPTFMFMKNGVQVEKLVGANPEEIRKRIDGFVQSTQIYTA